VGREARCTTAPSGEAIIADPSLDAVALFMPPWLRADPSSPRSRPASTCSRPSRSPPRRGRAPDPRRRRRIEPQGRRALRPHRRSLRARGQGRARGGELGRLALYKRDWVHASPKWNAWATDPVKNGGPFMDAMIHNLNAARFLMGRRWCGRR